VGAALEFANRVQPGNRSFVRAEDSACRVHPRSTFGVERARREDRGVVRAVICQREHQPIGGVVVVGNRSVEGDLDRRLTASEVVVGALSCELVEPLDRCPQRVRETLVQASVPCAVAELDQPFVESHREVVQRG
jgi:hypothetical protein